MTMRVSLFVIGVVAAALPVHAQVQAQAQVQAHAQVQTPPAPDDPYQRYLQPPATGVAIPPAPPPWMGGLFGDFKARRVNDLVTVRVIETVSGTGSADTTLDKDSAASASITNLFGIENRAPSWLDPTSLVALGANTSFSGGGSTSRAGSLVAVITARVVEVMPNGDLALEGVREIDINGDRQMIVLTGVIRPWDIGPGNVVPSTAIGQMQIRYFGQGLIKDVVQPGWLIRILNKIF